MVLNKVFKISNFFSNQSHRATFFRSLWEIALWIILLAMLRRIEGSGIVFYQGLAVSLFLVIFLYRRNVFSSNAVIFLLITYSLNMTIVTTVDRAYSVRLIEFLSRSNHQVSIKQMETMFQEEFVKAGAIEKRLGEQKSSGIIKCVDGECYLTSFGYFINKCFSIVRVVFSLEKNE